MVILILCMNCRKWVHRRCTKINGVTPILANNFVCAWCRKVEERPVEAVEKLCNEMETVNGLLFE